ncbi:MAG: helix-turn-helix transcriptional regulator [Patescibacteria group bacterium]|nr:helix-turn-helix transcriptional regulator [Patescibacteria group bacterium]
MSIGKRIKKTREDRGWSQSELARRLQVSPQTVQQWEGDETAPSRKRWDALARELGVSVVWLQFGAEVTLLRSPANGEREDMVRVDVVETATFHHDRERYAMIPRYDISPQAGAAVAIDSEAVVELISIDREWLRHGLHVDPSRVAIVMVHGDSMVPTLQPSEIILVNVSDRQPRDAIFVIRLEGELLVKRLQRLPGAIRVLSDNKEYAPFDVNLETQRFEIVGRVVFAWRGRSF